METKRKQRSDSVTQAAENFKNAATGISLPDGVELRNEDEFIIWGHFTRARATRCLARV
jgi:hypothetical protein